MTSLMEAVKHLKLSFEDIKLATKNFGHENLIAKGGFGKVYKGELTLSEQQITVAVKKLDPTQGQGNREFLMEIQMLSCCRHKNLVSLVGFCDENGEKILVYKYEEHGSLDRYLRDPTKLSWLQRLQISVGAARGFNYLHNDVGTHQRVLHRDIKSSNILLNENWEARVSDFGLSKMGPSNVQHTFLITNACGTLGYIDPEYQEKGIITKESDVYSFGVVLFEILCGRLAFIYKYQDERRFLAPLARRRFRENRLKEIIDPNLFNQMKEDSLNVFSMVAYQCVSEKGTERPTMGWIVEKLEKALELQISSKVTGFIRVGTWGKRSGDPQHYWSFELEKYHTLVKITIDHGDAIHSLMFTSESSGVFHTSDKAGCSTGGNMVSEVNFDADEKIIGINGTISTRDGNMIISSLSFVTNKRTHGPFGRATETGFSVPWDNGFLVGFYGIGSDYIDSIGVYVKTYEAIIKVGTWGSGDSYGPQNAWSFELEKNHHLEKIKIEHGDLIYSLMFTTKYRGVTTTSRKAGGWNGAERDSEVNFDWDEEINSINGTVAFSRGTYAGYTVIASISFVTNKRTYGPFGQVRGTPFTVPWDDGSFAGFYGKCGYFIDSIGVYLKATT